MKYVESLVAFVLCAASVSAQQTAPPTPPARPTPPASGTAPVAPAPSPAPAPARAPRGVILGPDGDLSGRVFIDTERLRMDAERIARDATDRSYDAIQRAQETAQRAMERFNERSFESANRLNARALEGTVRAQGLADRALAGIDFGAGFAPPASISPQISTTISASVSAALASLNDGLRDIPSYNSAYTIGSQLAYAPNQSRWDWQQDPDPADSLYRVAQDAMNRGDYRRSADLFAQVQTRYPKSTRLSRAAYNESLMRYRLGTSDELKTALRVLTDKTKMTSTAGDFGTEVGNLTMRVRGALAQRGDAEQQRIVAQEAQKGGCDRDELQVKSEALSAMAQSDMNAAVPMLRNVLNKKDPCTLELRRNALRILLRRQDTAATSAAIAVAKNNDETLELRIEAVNQLSRLPGDNAIATLEELMRSNTEPQIQRAAIRSLSSTENARARSSVRVLIERNDVSESLRAEALGTFSKDRNSTDDAAYLRSLYPKMQSEALKSAVLSAISRMGGSENDQFLLSVARNTGESTDLRSNAISRLARSNSTVSVSDLVRLYDVAESRTLRSQVVNALGQRKEPEALDKLIDILKNGTDANIRTQVVQYLGRNVDPKAKQALSDFMNKGN